MKAPLNPLLPRIAGYMQEKANAQRDAALRSGKPVYDFGIGDPREPTPEFIRKALRDAVPIGARARGIQRAKCRSDVLSASGSIILPRDSPPGRSNSRRGMHEPDCI